MGGWRKEGKGQFFFLYSFFFFFLTTVEGSLQPRRNGFVTDTQPERTQGERPVRARARIFKRLWSPRIGKE